MTRLDFTITFHTLFRVARGQGGGGAHDTVERDRLPATSLAGVMRATAKTLLGSENQVISSVFGSDSQPSPWRWSAARPVPRGNGVPAERPTDDWQQTTPAARVRIDQDTGTAQDQMLVLANHTGAEQATFSITKFRRLAADDLEKHKAVLKVVAQATRSVGAWRRRGFGWVGIRCEEEVDEHTVRTFLELKR